MNHPEGKPTRPEAPKSLGSFTLFGGDQNAPAGAAIEAALSKATKQSRRARPSMLLRVVRIGFAAALIASVFGGIGAYLWLDELAVFDMTGDQLDIIVKTRPQDNTLVYDRDGKKIGEFFNSYQVYVPYKKLPKHLVEAILAIEDRNFFQHKGFDPKGIARAALSRLKGSSSNQGASTLTQQVVRHFLLPNERTPQRKVQEIAMAIHLERRLKKERILEIYANSLFLGNGSYGVGAAAFRYFGKSVAELEPQESALIAGLFQSPSRYNPSRTPKRAKKRQNQVLKAMYQSGYISFAKAKELMKVPLVYKEYQPLNTQMAPYFVDYVKEQAEKLLAGKKGTVDSQGLRIYTTIDVELQRLAEEAIAESGKLLDEAEKRTAPLRTKSGKIIPANLEASILSTDPKTGEILAMVGGRDYAKTKFNRTYQALRSPGSSFKPVVFSLALQQKWKWSDVIFVSPVTINNYRPHTPDEDFLTETTLLRAFYRSMNTPTVELGEKLGLRPVLEQAKKLGIRSPLKEEFGSMLGSSDLTMMDLARVYGAFANSGSLVELSPITKITDRKGKILWKLETPAERATQVVTPQIAFLMTQAMRAVLQMGTGYTSAHLAGSAVGKSGTSNESTDNWFCGYAPNLTGIVWVGTDEHVPIHGDVTGGKLALPIWDRFMSKAFKHRRPEPVRAPPGVVTTVVHPKFGNRSPNGVRMYFLRGNEPAEGGSALEALSQSSEAAGAAGAGYRDVFGH